MQLCHAKEQVFAFPSWGSAAEFEISHLGTKPLIITIVVLIIVMIIIMIIRIIMITIITIFLLVRKLSKRTRDG